MSSFKTKLCLFNTRKCSAKKMQSNNFFGQLHKGFCVRLFQKDPLMISNLSSVHVMMKSIET